MKRIFSVLLLLVLVGIQAQTKYFPQVFFDKNKAQEQINYGKSTLMGVASTKQKNEFGFKPPLGKKLYPAEGTVVMLFPVTPYFEEFYALRKKYEKKPGHTVYMSEEAFKYRIETLTGPKGTFTFERLKPGKYYLETIVDFTAKGSYTEQTARTDTYNGYGNFLYSTPVYQTFFYNYAAANRESKFIEIKADGELKEINL
ncbi:hypothetical protein JI747_018610 [Chryseobacterium sp. RG1]|jgi:hypothetical protein|uniref:Carboxypeptidase regulatory-like domain-containing protein n=1 Tax=Chryseobacterium tagetis TaxID=2801334 RepID=A0ABS8A5D0_9FLAO|nr:hypothetical protein [Chryseobacterium tagetis]MCA6069184.1 hypothetical protein [Chryseobacterium tagetis]